MAVIKVALREASAEASASVAAGAAAAALSKGGRERRLGRAGGDKQREADALRHKAGRLQARADELLAAAEDAWLSLEERAP